MPMRPDGTAMWRLAYARARALTLAGVVALVVFAMLLTAAGKDPLRGYVDTLVYVFGNAHGFS
jgi:hypothetical protein